MSVDKRDEERATSSLQCKAKQEYYKLYEALNNQLGHRFRE